MRVTTARMRVPSGESCGVATETMRKMSSYANARGDADAGTHVAAASTATAAATAGKRCNYTALGILAATICVRSASRHE